MPAIPELLASGSAHRPRHRAAKQEERRERDKSLGSRVLTVCAAVRIACPGRAQCLLLLGCWQNIGCARAHAHGTRRAGGSRLLLLLPALLLLLPPPPPPRLLPQLRHTLVRPASMPLRPG
jgi:hypothetical protein